jgi:hypothetical protein
MEAARLEFRVWFSMGVQRLMALGLRGVGHETARVRLHVEVMRDSREIIERLLIKLTITLSCIIYVQELMPSSDAKTNAPRRHHSSASSCKTFCRTINHQQSLCLSSRLIYNLILFQQNDTRIPPCLPPPSDQRGGRSPQIPGGNHLRRRNSMLSSLSQCLKYKTRQCI